MLVIVGHGPSLLSGLGAVIDTHEVVRLKDGLSSVQRKDAKNWGSRTDYICARSLVFDKGNFPFWYFNDPPKWMEYYRSFNPRHKKPSTGLCAAFLAVDRGYKEIALIGYDRLLDPLDRKSRKWNEPSMCSLYGHDQRAEHEALMALPANIIDLVKYEAKEA